MKKEILAILLTGCMFFAISCGSDISEELSSAHFEGAAKASTIAEEVSKDALDEATEMQVESDVEAESMANEQMVWIPRTGSKYHRYSSCSNMKSPTEVPLSDAERMGYEPCKKCY